MAPSSSSRPARHHLPLLLILAAVFVSLSGLLASVPTSAAGGCSLHLVSRSTALCPFYPLAIFSGPFLTPACTGNSSDVLPELGGDALHREILRDETVQRIKELGKVRPIPFPRVLEIFSSRSAFPARDAGDLVRLLGGCVACLIG